MCPAPLTLPGLLHRELVDLQLRLQDLTEPKLPQSGGPCPYSLGHFWLDLNVKHFPHMVPGQRHWDFFKCPVTPDQALPSTPKYIRPCHAE